MNKKIIISLATIGAVAAIAVGGTIAYFSDTETSTGNTFTAGTLDLKIDSTQHYNHMVCTASAVADVYTWQPEAGYIPVVGDYPAVGSPCSGTWEATDLGAQKFFAFSDVKPGDSGENTISLHVDNNDAWVRLAIRNVTDFDNSCTGPEEKSILDACTVAAPELEAAGMGELRENMLFTVFSDANCNNIKDDNDVELISAGTIDAGGEIWPLSTPVKGDTTVCFGITWNLPILVGNEAQSDSMGATMELEAVQYRNNPNPWAN